MKREVVINLINKTQDGGSITNQGDQYSKFLLECVDDNTNNEGLVDLDQVQSDISYGISEFKKALSAVETIIEV